MHLLRCEISFAEEQQGLLSIYPEINNAWLLNKETIDYGYHGHGLTLIENLMLFIL